MTRLPTILTRFLVAACTLGTALAPIAAMDLGTNFWNLKWHAKDDCFRDVGAVAGDDPWNPQFLQDIQPFQSLRFMDWGAVNNSQRSQWSERIKKDNPVQTTVAYEWMIDLCNRSRADLWLCLPHLSVDRTLGDRPADYALRLALLVKTGVDMGGVDLVPLLDRLAVLTADDLVRAGGIRTSAPLNPGLRVYFEYSNETWNGMFKQARYACAEGSALGLNPDPKPNEKGEDWTAGYRFHAWAALRVFRAVDLVFGSESPRVVKVLATHTASTFVTRQHLEVMASRTWNPWGVKATAIASAPYFGHKVDGADAAAVAQLREAIDRSSRQSAEQAELARGAGLRLIAYEGGQHVGRNADVINRDTAMFELYGAYLAEMAKYFDHFSHYCHVGQAGPKGAWGALERTGQPLAEAHKHRALVGWAQEHPRRPLGDSAPAPGLVPSPR